MTHFVGVDVGGTKSAAVLLDGAGAIVARDWTEDAARQPGTLVATVLSSIDRVTAAGALRLDEVAAFGVAVAGLVADDGSTIVRSPIIGESRLPLGSELATRLAAPVVVMNDANATLYGIVRGSAEAPGRVAAESRVALLLTLGTGLGGAVMVGDRIVSGEHGFAAELGHVTVDFDDRRSCVCGNRGCAEQFASGRGVAELAAAAPPPDASVETLRELGATPPYSARAVVAAAERGDPWASALLGSAGAMLGRAISILCVVLDPTTVIVAGSFGHAAAPWLLPAALAEMRDRWPYAEERPLPALTTDSFGRHAAATGAALLAAARYGKDEGQ